MNQFLLKLRALSLALVLAVSVQPILGMSTATDSWAGGKGSAVVVASSGTHIAGYLVAGVFISVASIMACAAIVSAHLGREMTPEEALLSGAVPLGCLLSQHLNR